MFVQWLGPVFLAGEPVGVAGSRSPRWPAASGWRWVVIGLSLCWGAGREVCSATAASEQAASEQALPRRPEAGEHAASNRVSIAFSDSSQPSWGSLGSRPSVAGVAQPKQLVRQVFLTYASPPLGLYTSRLFAQSASGDWLYLQQQFSNA
ncbi:unnamed protein product [Prorocentrum cordatum]|uniref:Phospholipase B-like n=1 Tax=Prorocentrum cordatum TaxID=2364126 RepID=A0ABN9WKN7_9DINO|nr:unnamed protein product [Polarella glacialis]